MSSSKRKAPLSASAGILTSEQAGQPGAGGPSSSSAIAGPSSLRQGSNSKAKKRLRFADGASKEDGDDLLDNEAGMAIYGDIDLEEQERKRAQGGRKGRVDTAGYDSESSDEEEDEETSLPDGKSAVDLEEEEEDDDDMFQPRDAVGATGSGDQVLPSSSKGKGKASGELEIEGQEDLQTGTAAGMLSDEEDDGEDRDPDLELESDSDDDDQDFEDLDAEAAGETTPPLSPGGTTVLPKPKKKKVKKSSKQNGDAAMDGDQPQLDMNDMGFKMEGFNVKRELASGRYDEEGNYIPNAKDPHSEHDKWLEGNYSRNAIRRARESKAMIEQKAKEREREAQAEETEGEGAVGIAKEVCEYMESGETVLECLQRLGAHAKKYRTGAANKRKAARGKKSSNGDDTDMATTESAASPSNGSTATPRQDQRHPSVRAIEHFTSLTSTLMTRYGQTDLYDETYESLLRAVRRSGQVEADWDPARDRAKAAALLDDGPDDSSSGPASTGDAVYEYRWSPSYLEAARQTSTAQSSEGLEDQVFGPFDVATLRAWKEAGYFGEAGGTDRILLRPKAGDADGPWKTWEQVFAA